jgi:NAD-dependent dihydropyrimidine dehydrogenase PreA subunit
MNVRVKIDYGLCTGCKQCVKSCVFGVIEWLDDEPLVANPGSCNSCMDCVHNCPVKAVTVEVS